jgi:hypothetical protein
VVNTVAGAAGAAATGAWGAAFEAVSLAFKAFLSPQGQAMVDEIRQKHGLTSPEQAAIAAGLPTTDPIKTVTTTTTTTTEETTP